jgi:hypothetical protein
VSQGKPKNPQTKKTKESSSRSRTGPVPVVDVDEVAAHVPRRITPKENGKRIYTIDRLPSSEEDTSEDFETFVKSMKGEVKAKPRHIAKHVEEEQQQDDDEGEEDKREYADEGEDDQEEQRDDDDREDDERYEVERYEDERVEDDEDEEEEVKYEHDKVRYKARKGRLVNKTPCDTCARRNKVCHMQDSLKARGACYECGSQKIRCIFTVCFIYLFNNKITYMIFSSIVKMQLLSRSVLQLLARQVLRLLTRPVLRPLPNPSVQKMGVLRLRNKSK